MTKRVKVRYDYLKKLADFLLKDADNKTGLKFDMGSWGECSIDDKIGVSCGTTACALGSAAIARLFPGLTYKTSPYDSWDGTEKLTIDIQYKGLSDVEGAAELFGITEDEACFLFIPSYYPQEDNTLKGAKGERIVAKRIFAFIEAKKVREKILDEMEASKKRTEGYFKEMKKKCPDYHETYFDNEWDDEDNFRRL